MTRSTISRVNLVDRSVINGNLADRCEKKLTSLLQRVVRRSCVTTRGRSTRAFLQTANDRQKTGQGVVTVAEKKKRDETAGKKREGERKRGDGGRWSILSRGASSSSATANRPIAF